MAVFRQRDIATNKVMFDSGAGDKAGIIMGSFNIDYQVNPDGDIDIPGISGGTPWAFVRGPTYEGSPTVTFSGRTLSWRRTRTSTGGFSPVGQYEIIYGGIDLTNLEVSGARMTLRDNNTNRIIFSTYYALYQHNGMASLSGRIIQYQSSDGYNLVAPNYVPARMVALRPTGTPMGVTGTAYGNGQAIGTSVVVAKNATPSGSFYCIEKPTIVAAKPGLNCRSIVTNELTFSSAQQTARIVDVIDSASRTWTGTPGRIYAAVFGSSIGYIEDESTEITRNPGGGLIIGQDPPYYVIKYYFLTVVVPPDTPHALQFNWMEGSGNAYGDKRNQISPSKIDRFGKILILDVTGL